ncbi:MAG: hypothetical protein R3F20_03755 [Planctomycetota bacterium]
MSPIRITVALGFILLVAGCADYRIRKVPNAYERALVGQTWTEADQRSVEEMEGIRFYMSRAYVDVHKPFPIDSDVFVVDGTVSADGRFLVVDRPTGSGSEADGKASRYLSSAGGGALRLGTQRIVVSATGSSAAPNAARAGAQSATEGGADPAVSDGKGPPTPSSGQESFKVSTDLSATALVPTRDFFDVIFLPDYSEQYVIQTEANLGELDITLTYGPGNVLIGLDAKVDNSAVTGPLMDFYRDVMKAGTAAVKSQILPAAAQSATETMRGEEYAGSRVSVAVHVLRFAAPGLYPIQKPNESFALLQDSISAPEEHVLIGRPPASCVSIKYYEVLVAELLGAGARTATSVLDGSVERAPRAALPAPKPNSAGPTALTPAALDEFKANLQTLLGPDGWGVDSVKAKDGGIAVTLLQTALTPGITATAAQDFAVEKGEDAFGVPVTATIATP